MKTTKTFTIDGDLTEQLDAECKGKHCKASKIVNDALRTFLIPRMINCPNCKAEYSSRLSGCPTCLAKIEIENKIKAEQELKNKNIKEKLKLERALESDSYTTEQKEQIKQKLRVI